VIALPRHCEERGDEATQTAAAAIVDRWLRLARTVVLAVAAILAASLGAAPAHAQARFRAIEVDVAPLRQGGNTEAAERVARELPPLLQKSFAAHLAPADRSAPVLCARIDFVTLGMAGSAGGPHSIMATDFIEGAGVVIGAGGRVIASYPLTSNLTAPVPFNDISGEGNRLRFSNLESSFAQWLPGKMGL
jgi:hypothetical protein